MLSVAPRSYVSDVSRSQASVSNILFRVCDLCFQGVRHFEWKLALGFCTTFGKPQDKANVQKRTQNLFMPAACVSSDLGMVAVAC